MKKKPVIALVVWLNQNVYNMYPAHDSCRTHINEYVKIERMTDGIISVPIQT